MTWVVRAIRSNGGVARLRSVIFSPSTMHDRDEIWVAKGRRRAGDGQATATARIGDGPDSPGRLTKNRTLAQPAHGKAQFGRSEARRMRLSVKTRAQNALFRDVARPECAFPSRRGAREVWGNPPARLRGTMENASTGQMRSSNPPPGCGVGCAGVRKSRLGVWSHGKAHSEALWPSHLTEKRTLAQTAQGASRKSAVWSVRGSQNAPFREDPCPECAFP